MDDELLVLESDISLIESEFEYANYIAQKEFLDELALISLSLNESYIIEADTANNIKNAIMRFIHKVVANVQVAWNKFKRKMTESAWKKIKDKYGTELNMNRELEIVKASNSDLFVNWENVFKFLGMDIKLFVTKDMGESDETAIVKQLPYFANIEKFSKKNMQEIVAGNCFTKIQNGNSVKLDMIKEYSGYLDNIDNILAPIENTIATFNELEKKIEANIKNVDGKELEIKGGVNPTTTNNNTTQATEAFNVVLNKAAEYITELTVEDKADPKGEQTVKGGGNDMQKKATKLIKVATTVLSIEMWCANKAVTKSLTVVLAYVRNAAKYNPNRKKENKENK